MNQATLGPLIAKGRTAEVFAWKKDQVIKLFFDWVPKHWAQNEIDIGRILSTKEIATPKFIEAIEIEGRAGIVYERVYGPSLLTLIGEKPWLLLRLARQMAELHAQIHAQDGSGFPSVHASLRATILRVESLSTSEKEAILHLLEQLPQGKALCHGDFHPDQILITANGAVVIDWPNVAQGHPLADVARTTILLLFGDVLEENVVKRTLIKAMRKLFYQAYLTRYLALQPHMSRKEIEAWSIPLAAARLEEGIQGEETVLLAFLKRQLSKPGLGVKR